MTALDPGVPPSLRLLAEGRLDHCENVAWDATTSTAILGGEGGQLYRVALDGTCEEVARVEGAFLLGLALDVAGAVFACDMAGGRVLRIDPDGRAVPFGPSLGTPNFPALAPDGTLYVTLNGTHNGDDGGLVALDAAGRPTPVPLGRPLRFPNALAVDGDELVVIESDGQRVCRVPRDGGDPVVVAELPGTVPDGLALDAEGGIWVSCYQPNRIVRLAPDGTRETIADDLLGWMLPMPTGLCFGGDDLRTLLVACLGGWSLAAIDAPIAGRPVPRPRLDDEEGR